MGNEIKIIFYSHLDRKIINEIIRQIRELNGIFAIDISGLEDEKTVKSKKP